MDVHTDSRALRAGLRAGGRLGIPGWFPLVVERVHRRLDVPAAAEHAVDGAVMRLDIDDYVERRIYYECHEPHEVSLVRRLVRPGDLVLDVGAFVGLFTLVAAVRVGPHGAVHAFEPVPATFARLSANVAANGLAQVRLNRAAVGAREGTMKLGLQGPEVPMATDSAAFYTRIGSNDAVSAPVVSLDAYAAEHLRGRRIRLVKIDAEGSEPDVLAGMGGTLAAMPPDVVVMEVSVLHLDRQGRAVEELLDPLVRNGYDLRRVGAFARLAPARPEQLSRTPWGARIGARWPRSMLLHTIRGLLGRSGLVNLVAVRPGAPGVG